MNLQSSVNRPFPSTPGRGYYGETQQQNNNTANIGYTSNDGGGAATTTTTTTTPRRRTTMTPSRYIPPSPLPGTSLGGGSLVGTSSSHPHHHHQQQQQQQGQQASQKPTFIPLQYRVVSSDPHLKVTMEQDKANVDATLRALREGKSERRRKHEGLKVELLEEERSWENECERLRKEGAQIVKALEREKAEVAESSATVSSLENRKRNLAGQLDALKADIEEWSARIRARKEFNAQERKAFEDQAKRDLPELRFFEDKLGLVIQGRPNDVVSFKFTLVDPADHRRAFSFDLDASQPTYTLSSCTPSLHSTTLRKHLGELNQSRDLYAFLRRMRRSFSDLVREEGKDKHAVYSH